MIEGQIEGQRRLSRNRVFFVVPMVLLGLSTALLVWAVVQDNLPPLTRTSWPWRLTLLDVQSACNATVVAAGLVFARAQYARAVQPLLSARGEVLPGGPDGGPKWTAFVWNGSPHSAVLHTPRYRLVLRDEGTTPQRWMSKREVEVMLDSRSLQRHRDYRLTEIGPAAGLPVLDGYPLGYFSEAAMAVVSELWVRVRVTAQSGDVYQRDLPCLRGATPEALR